MVIFSFCSSIFFLGLILSSCFLSCISCAKLLTQNSHGDGRSSSSLTFHVALRLTSEGEYHTCLKVGSGDGTVVDGSVVNWGQTRPSLQSILNHYKRMYQVDVTTSSSSSGSDDDRRGGGSGGRGGKGRRGGWQKQVMKADDGSYFYLDEQEEYIPCDANGQAIQTSYRLHYDSRANKAYYTGSDRKTHWFDGRAYMARAQQSYSSKQQGHYSSGGQQAYYSSGGGSSRRAEPSYSRSSEHSYERRRR